MSRDQRGLERIVWAPRWTREYGDDIPAVRDWTWPAATGTGDGPRAPLSDTSADFTPEIESGKR